MSDILDQIVTVKREEIATAQRKISLAAMRADAESRVLTRDFGVKPLRFDVSGPVIKVNGRPFPQARFESRGGA